MRAVVADTSPLNYLTLIGYIDALRSLYGKVAVPHEVVAELQDVGAPPPVREWIRSRPEWIKVDNAGKLSGETSLFHLGPGERAAIALALARPEALLLSDDAAGRVEAKKLGVRITGTIGILRAAALHDLLDLPTALRRLAETNFRISKVLVDQLLLDDFQRKHPASG